MIGMMAIVGGIVGIPHREGPRRLMASRALRRPVHFPVIFLRMPRQLILTSKGKYHGQHADDF